MEYAIRSAQIGVYSLLRLKKEVPPFYKGQRDPRVLMDSLETMLKVGPWRLTECRDVPTICLATITDIRVPSSCDWTRAPFRRDFDVNSVNYARAQAARLTSFAKSLAPSPHPDCSEPSNCRPGIGHRNLYAERRRGVVDDDADKQLDLHHAKSRQLLLCLFSCWHCRPVRSETFSTAGN